MKKIFFGGPGACGVHYEKNMCKFLLEMKKNFEITSNFQEADIIVIIDTCLATYSNVLNTFNYIEKVLFQKKNNAQVIVSGCITKGLKFELNDRQKEILKQVIVVTQDEILKYFAEVINFELNDNILNEFKIPFNLVSENRIELSIVSGCLNNCSFCKTNFANFNLKSVPYENIEQMTLNISSTSSINHMHIHSSNLSLYGVDLYGKQRSHEAIKLLTSPESIKFVSVGALINWYPKLIKEIVENPKIKTVFISLETGSPRLYQLMNRPISLEKLVEIIKVIRKNRPDIIVETEFIAGFPTETIDDLKKSIELSYELGVMPLFINPFINSKQIPISNLPQHSLIYCKESAQYLIDSLYPLHNKFEDMIKNGEMFVVKKYEQYHAYKVLLVDGRIINVNFDRFDKEYNVGDLIEANTIKPKQFVKIR